MKGIEPRTLYWIAFLVASAFNAYVAVALTHRDIWPRLPWVRRARERDEAVREFKEMAPALEAAATTLVGVLDAEVIPKGSHPMNKPYAELQVLLQRLRIQFGIDIGTDPLDLVLHPEKHERFAAIVAFARSGDLDSAINRAQREDE